ncbi:uncharacterized protein LOC143205341 isoform X2 [Rhynchophorus ferrugineus]|uniref:uncharacterized protein LOC143205341 isoform X2 n=1 Tax=Rhynchophorus ferrugineus TaxID=354439 RepID=UPI003FCEA1E1
MDTLGELAPKCDRNGNRRQCSRVHRAVFCLFVIFSRSPKPTTRARYTFYKTVRNPNPRTGSILYKSGPSTSPKHHLQFGRCIHIQIKSIAMKVLAVAILATVATLSSAYPGGHYIGGGYGGGYDGGCDGHGGAGGGAGCGGGFGGGLGGGLGGGFGGGAGGGAGFAGGSAGGGFYGSEAAGPSYVQGPAAGPKNVVGPAEGGNNLQGASNGPSNLVGPQQGPASIVGPSQGGAAGAITYDGGVLKGPVTVPVVIKGSSGKIVADGLYGLPTGGHGH